MGRFVFVIAGLVMLGVCVCAEDKPVKDKPVALTMFFEEATLDEVMAKIGTEAGYKVIRSREVDGEVPITLDLGRVSVEVACLMIEEYTDLRLIINPKRKVIEVRERGYRSVFTELVFVDTRKLCDAFMVSQDSLGRRKTDEGTWHYADSSDATYALDYALQKAIGFDTDFDHVTLNKEGLTAHLEAREREEIDELFALLLAEGGGRSKWLEAQAETFEKLSKEVLTFEADAALKTILAEVARKLGVSIALHADIRDTAGEEPVAMAFDKMPALDVLELLLDQCDLKLLLLGNLVYVVPEDAEPAGLTETGYAAYELGALVADRAAASKEQSNTLAWDTYDAILDGLYVAIGCGRDAVARFGTRVIVRGDMTVQKAATDYLTALGWKAK